MKFDTLERTVEILQTKEFQVLEFALRYQLSILKKQMLLIQETLNKQKQMFVDTLDKERGTSMFDFYLGALNTVIDDYSVSRIEKFLEATKK